LKQTTEIDINESVICDTSHLGIIKVSGEDTSTFLQGQFSNDINLLSETNSQLNSYNSAKGRMFASFRLFQKNEDYLLLLPREIIEPIIKRLRMFVMRSKVVLDDLSDNWKSIGLSGPAINKELTQVPENIDGVVHDGLVSFIHIPGVNTRVLIVGPNDEIDKITNELNKKLTPTDANHWKRLDIHAGLPNIYSTTQESFVAQMVNLPLVNGVSFTKGCYPGQEVVARMHYLGKLKKRMYRIIIEDNTTPTPGENLYLGDNENSQSIGEIVDAQPNNTAGIDALAVIQVNAIEKGNIRLATQDGPTVNVGELPYSFEANT